MQTIEGFDFFPLTFNDDGAMTSREEFEALVEHARSHSATDIVFIAHGFRNDAADATRLYTKFMETLRGNLGRGELETVAARRILVAGVFWPSQSFRETFGDDADRDGSRPLRPPDETLAELRRRLEKLKAQATPSHRAKLDKAIALLPTLGGNPKAQDEFVALVLSLLENADSDPAEGIDEMRAQTGSTVIRRLSAPPDGTQTASRDVFDTIAGGVGTFLNLTMWYVMKERSGTVGAAAVADAVRELKANLPEVKVHLVGHSLGARLMAACVKSLASDPMIQPDSLMLLEAAFSHFGLSEDDGKGTRGFFRDVIARQAVKGPLLSTFSSKDSVLANAYAIMSRLAGDRTRDIGDEQDPFGALGRNGPLRMDELAAGTLVPPGDDAYDFKTGVVNSLDGSGGLIRNHGDVTNEAVTYAFARAVALT
jgi:hypothetical protein